VESPSLEIFQPRLDAVLCSRLWVTLLGQGVGLGDTQRSLPTLNILCLSQRLGTPHSLELGTLHHFSNSKLRMSLFGVCFEG